MLLQQSLNLLIESCNVKVIRCIGTLPQNSVTLKISDCYLKVLSRQSQPTETECIINIIVTCWSKLRYS